jgi:hypothetical protein
VTKRMCLARSNSGAASRQITNPNTGNTFAMDAQGCVLAQEVDVPWLLGQGFSFGNPFGPGLTLTTGVAAGVTSFPIGDLPAGAFIDQIIIKNATGNVVTGGIAIGSAAGAADIVAAQPCGANALTHVADASILKRVLSDSVVTRLFATAVTAWNGASVTISIVFGFY